MALPQDLCAFTVLAASTITNTGPTTLSGDVGLSPGSSITGFPPGIVNGEVHAADASAALAKTALASAYDETAGYVTTVPLTAAQDIGVSTIYEW